MRVQRINIEHAQNALVLETTQAVMTPDDRRAVMDPSASGSMRLGCRSQGSHEADPAGRLGRRSARFMDPPGCINFLQLPVGFTSSTDVYGTALAYGLEYYAYM